MKRFHLLFLIAAVALACSSSVSSVGSTLAIGTWGAKNAGVLVSDQGAHVHVGCTYGDFPGTIAITSDGDVDAAGSYLLRAYPVAVGPTMPARLEGHVERNRFTLTVTVNDTIQHQTTTLGPVEVEFGVEPEMGPCPICRMPAAWTT